MVPLELASYMSENVYRQRVSRQRPGAAPLTLHEFILLDIAAPVPVDRLEHCLPLVDVVKEGGELVDVDLARPVHVEHFYAKAVRGGLKAS